MTGILVSVAICAVGIFAIGFVFGFLVMWGYECDIEDHHG